MKLRSEIQNWLKMIKMKRVFILILISTGFILLNSCKAGKKANIVYMPDMYYPVAYDPYQEANFEYWPQRMDKTTEVMLFKDNNNMTALWPAHGTVPITDEQMILPWELKNTLDDYNKSKEITSSPLNRANRDKDLERGEKLYAQTCAVCHGAAGDGQGSIVKTGAYTGVPTYEEREISVGSVYHVIEYGRNAMGSYAPQLNPIDRWRVAEYVMKLKGVDTTAQAAPATQDNETEDNAE